MNTYVGVDIHKSFSQIHAQSQEGTSVHQGRLYHDPMAKPREFVGELPGQVHVAGGAGIGRAMANTLQYDETT